MEFFNLFEAKGGGPAAKTAVGKSLKFSYTGYKDLLQCPAKYAMARVLWWTPRTLDQRNFCLGSVGHSCMEHWIKQGNFELGYMQRLAKDEFDLYLTKNTVVPINKHDIHDMREKSVVNAQAIEDTFVEYGLTKKMIISEKKWNVPLPNYPNVILTGILDLLIPEDRLILDLKVTKNASFMDDLQLTLYSLMGVLAGHKTTKAGFLVPLRKEKLVELEFGAADFTSLYRDIQDALSIIEEGLKTGLWAYRYNQTGCFRCGVKDFCERYKIETSPIDRPVVDYGSGTVIKF